VEREVWRLKRDNCNWFGSLGVVRIWLYIEMSGNCKILAKTTQWIELVNDWIDSGR